MKATLEFDLPEEQDEFETAVNAHKFRGVISDFLNETRSLLKHGSCCSDTKVVRMEDLKSADEAAETLRQIVVDMLAERNLEVW